MVQQSKPNTASSIQTQVCSHYNKAYCRYESEHTVGNVLYQHYCSFCMRETHKKFDHPSVKCLRAKISQQIQNQKVQNLGNKSSIFDKIECLSRCGMYVFSQTQLINHINEKKFTVESYSSNSTCCSVLNSFIDAPSWHTGRNHYCYAVALSISVDFVKADKTDSWVLTKAKNIKCVEVQTSECQVNKNVWLHSYSHGCNESESFTSVNSFTNPYVLYSSEYVLSLYQVSAGTVDTNLLDLASNLGCINIGQEIGTCKRQSELSLLFEGYDFYCSLPGSGPHNSLSQVLNILSHGSGLEYMYYSAFSVSHFSSNSSFPLYDTNCDIIYDNS